MNFCNTYNNLIKNNYIERLWTVELFYRTFSNSFCLLVAPMFRCIGDLTQREQTVKHGRFNPSDRINNISEFQRFRVNKSLTDVRAMSHQHPWRPWWIFYLTLILYTYEKPPISTQIKCSSSLFFALSNRPFRQNVTTLHNNIRRNNIRLMIQSNSV
jgi:hypothetical protein